MGHWHGARPCVRLEPSHQRTASRQRAQKAVGWREHSMWVGNTMRFALAPSLLACGLHTDPSHERMQGRGGKASPPEVGGHTASTSSGLGAERAEPIRGHCLWF